VGVDEKQALQPHSRPPPPPPSPTSLPSPVRCDAFLTPARCSGKPSPLSWSLWVLPALVRTTQRRSVVRLGCADALHSHLGPCCDANAGTRPRKGRERERERECVLCVFLERVCVCV
ncbi:hypothetical protein JZ751_028545, partial [Albula glossodonta]